MAWNTGCQFTGRTRDDLQHLGGRGLLLQRFAQLVKQARILDRDDGLRGEVLNQLDLLVGEWSAPLGGKSRLSRSASLSLSSGTFTSAFAPPNLASVSARLLGSRQYVWNVNDVLSCASYAPDYVPARVVRAALAAAAPREPPALRAMAMTRNASPSRSDMTPNLAPQSCIAFANMVSKHRLQFAG